MTHTHGLTGYSPELLYPPPHYALRFKRHQQRMIIKHNLDGVALLRLCHILDTHNGVIQRLNRSIKQWWPGILWKML